MTIINQDNFIEFINNNSLSSIPRTILLEGNKGSGRRTLCKYIAEHYSINIEDITDMLNQEFIESLYLRPTPYLYVIDGDKLTVKNENAILKFLEEPLKNALIVLLCENKHLLLSTIRNRCFCHTLNRYSEDDLKLFLNNQKNSADILKLCQTPGDVLLFANIDIEELNKLCNKIFDLIHQASVANTLTLSNNLAFKNEKDKYDVDIFMRALLSCAYNRALSNVGYGAQDYLLTAEYCNRAKVKNIDKKYLFEHFLLKLKQSRC